MNNNALTTPPPHPFTHATGHPSSDNTVDAPLARVLGSVPPMIRLPAPGKRCPFTQLSRTSMVELIKPMSRNNHRPPVRAIYHRAHPHAQRGIWLIPAEHLFRYLLGLMDAPAETHPTTTSEQVMRTPEEAGSSGLLASRNEDVKA